MRFMKKATYTIILSVTLLISLYFLVSQTSQLQDPKPLDPNTYPIPTKSKLNLHENEDIEDANESMVKAHNVATDSRKLVQFTKEAGEEEQQQPLENSVELSTQAFMPQMANETLKAELGRASWRLFHTILARYPEKPTTVEQSTLKQYIYLFAQVYPCGDCARHFQGLLEKYHPQTSGRVSASLWGCDIHNKVNQRLGKEIYDCSTILEDYDCGCGADEELDSQDQTKYPPAAAAAAGKMSLEKEALKEGQTEGKFKSRLEEDHLRFELNEEEKQRG